MSEPVLTVANQLTILRMALTPVLLVLILSGRHAWALVVFVVAGLTDLLDGLFARWGHQRTTLGAMLDPVADKVLLSSSYVALTWGRALPCPVPDWLTVTVLSRDAMIIVGVVVINLTVGRRVFHPSLLGKVSTACQVVTAGLVLAANAAGHGWPALEWLFWLTLVLAVASAGDYVRKASVPLQPGQNV
jgi:cardiolipin synthase